MSQSGREKIARELADTEAMRAADSLRKRMKDSGASPDEISDAVDAEFRRVYDETFAETMLGGS